MTLGYQSIKQKPQGTRSSILFFLNITPLFAMGYISEVKLQVTIQ